LDRIARDLFRDPFVPPGAMRLGTAAVALASVVVLAGVRSPVATVGGTVAPTGASLTTDLDESDTGVDDGATGSDDSDADGSGDPDAVDRGLARGECPGPRAGDGTKTTRPPPGRNARPRSTSALLPLVRPIRDDTASDDGVGPRPPTRTGRARSRPDAREYQTAV
jgi:hypothetical protein